MQIETRVVDGVTVIDIAGRLDTQTSGNAKEEVAGIIRRGTDKVVLNLDRLEYINSSGLRLILTAAKSLKAMTGEFKVCHANGVVKEVLEVAGFNQLIAICDEEKDAIAELNV